MNHRLIIVPLLVSLVSCVEKVDGTSLQSTEASIQSMSEGLDTEEVAKFRKDFNTVVFSLPPFRAPAHLNGMTRGEIQKEALVIRLKSEIKSTEDRIAMLHRQEKEYATEDSIRDDAPAELAKIRVLLQQVAGGGGLEQASVGCIVQVQNNSRHTLSRLWWRSENASGDSMIVPELKPGEARTLNDCGVGAFLVESTSSLVVEAERAELPGTGPDLEPWERPEDRLRLIRPEEELPGLGATLARLQSELKAAG